MEKMTREEAFDKLIEMKKQIRDFAFKNDLSAFVLVGCRHEEKRSIEVSSTICRLNMQELAYGIQGAFPPEHTDQAISDLLAFLMSKP